MVLEAGAFCCPKKTTVPPQSSRTAISATPDGPARYRSRWAPDVTIRVMGVPTVARPVAAHGSGSAGGIGSVGHTRTGTSGASMTAGVSLTTGTSMTGGVSLTTGTSMAGVMSMTTGTSMAGGDVDDHGDIDDGGVSMTSGISMTGGVSIGVARRRRSHIDRDRGVGGGGDVALQPGVFDVDERWIRRAARHHPQRQPPPRGHAEGTHARSLARLRRGVERAPGCDAAVDMRYLRPSPMTSPRPRIGVVLNANAGRTRRDPGLADRLRAKLTRDDLLVSTRSPDELTDAAERFRAHGVTLLAWSAATAARASRCRPSRGSTRPTRCPRWPCSAGAR